MMPQIKTVERTVITRFVEVAGKWRFPVSQTTTTKENLDETENNTPVAKSPKAKKAPKAKAEKKPRELKYSDEKILGAYKKNHSVQDAMKAVGCSYAWARWRCQFHGVFKPSRKEAK